MPLKYLLQGAPDKKIGRQEKDRRKVERKLKVIAVEDIRTEFKKLSEDQLIDLELLLSGKTVGRDFFHLWVDGQTLKTFRGRVEKIRKNMVCRIAYWDPEEETYDDALDYNVSVYELEADLINGDLALFEFVCIYVDSCFY